MPPRTHEILDKGLLERLYFQEGWGLSAIALLTGTNYRLVRDSFRFYGLVWRTKSEASKGHFVSETTKVKISDARKGWKDAPDVADKKRKILAGICNWMLGVPVDDSRRIRQHEALVKAMRRPEVRSKLSERRTQEIMAGTYWKRGTHVSPKAGAVHYQSGWELRRWKELDEDPTVLSYRRSPCAISYIWEDTQRNYIPDILITYQDGTHVLEEIKPESIVVQAFKEGNRTAAKLRAGQKYAEVNGWGWRVFWYPNRPRSGV